jgi:hypothetical protein
MLITVQEFVPRGRQQIKEHPGEVVLSSTQSQLHPESFLLHRLSQVAISDTSKVGLVKYIVIT